MRTFQIGRKSQPTSTHPQAMPTWRKRIMIRLQTTTTATWRQPIRSKYRQLQPISSLDSYSQSEVSLSSNGQLEVYTAISASYSQSEVSIAAIANLKLSQLQPIRGISSYSQSEVQTVISNQTFRQLQPIRRLDNYSQSEVSIAVIVNQKQV